MYRNITLDDIIAFVLVARLGSFALAAEELHVTQSALSRRIKKLETTLGASLLDRTTRKVAVSTLGLEFLPQAVRIMDDFNRSVDDINEIIKVRKGIISFSCNMTLSDTLLPDILKRFKDEHPDIRVRVHEDSSPQAMEKVLNGQSELALAQYGEGHPDLDFEPLINDQFVILCPKSHPLANVKQTTWEEIKNESFILLTARSGTNKLLRRTLGPLYDELPNDVEVGHFHAQLGMVEKGIGITAIPSLIRLSRKDLDLATIPVSDPVVSRKLGIVTYRGRSLSPAAMKLRDIAAEVMKEASM